MIFCATTIHQNHVLERETETCLASVKWHAYVTQWRCSKHSLLARRREKEQCLEADRTFSESSIAFVASRLKHETLQDNVVEGQKCGTDNVVMSLDLVAAAELFAEVRPSQRQGMEDGVCT